MSDQVTTYTPERLARLLTDAGFTTVAETIEMLQFAINDTADPAWDPTSLSAAQVLEIHRHGIDLVLDIYAACVDPDAGMVSAELVKARDDGWPEAEDLITRQVECLTHLRATCDSDQHPGLILQALAMHIDGTGMGS